MSLALTLTLTRPSWDSLAFNDARHDAARHRDQSPHIGLPINNIGKFSVKLTKGNYTWRSFHHHNG